MTQKQPVDAKDAWAIQSARRPALTAGSTSLVSAAQDVIEAPGLLRTIRNDLDNELVSLRGTLRVDVHLTDQGREARYAEAGARIRARYATPVASIRDDIDRAERLFTAAIDRVSAARMTGVEGVLTRQAHWARVRDMLAADIHISKIIADATDLEMLHAIADELPTWLRVRLNTADDAAISLEGWMVRIDARRAQLAPEPARADAMLAVEARPDLQLVIPALVMTERITAGEVISHAEQMQTAIAGQMAQNAARVRDDIEVETATNRRRS